jgi:predicted ATP-grasp superfamily ATP-dependent carboligase
MPGKSVAIFYEHPDWFKPLFAELERRNILHERLYLRQHWYDPALRDCAYSLVVNRVSAYPSGGTHPEVVLYVKQYLAYLEGIGADVVNGYHSYLVGTSKAMQLDIFEQLGLDYPRARVIHDPAQALAAAEGLVCPLIVKPNIGGSGAGILKFESQDELALAVKAGALDLGIDQTALVQEHLSARGQCIIRVEILNGEYLYALRLPIAEDSFNYCPADGCNVDNPELAVEAYAPPAEIIAAAQRVLAASQADLGSVEYLINERDGRPYYYDINPLSNFVANAPDVVGFDPFVTFVDFILDRAGL